MLNRLGYLLLGSGIGGNAALPAPPPGSSFTLLADGLSYLLLADGIGRLARA